jgi:hypothetical protein
MRKEILVQHESLFQVTIPESKMKLHDVCNRDVLNLICKYACDKIYRMWYIFPLCSLQ